MRLSLLLRDAPPVKEKSLSVKHFGGLFVSPSRCYFPRVDTNLLVDILLTYACFIPVLTFHEFAHAWTASKCGDDTAKDLGRITLNPIAHMELIGTVILPLTAMFLSATGSVLAGFIIGWGKPVPVNLNNLRNPRRDDTLIALAGPMMNLLLALILMGVIKLAVGIGSEELLEYGKRFVIINLVLAFFNLIPIPPLDGSHVLWNLMRWSYESFYQFAQYGFLAIILILQVPIVRQLLFTVVSTTFVSLARIWGVG
jgi:Zn-dependent protease